MSLSYREKRYAGETVAKKLERYFFWSCVQESLGERFYDGHYLGLSSEEAGDASVLQGLGITPSRIVLSEMDVKACATARKKFPLVSIYNEDVLNTVKRFAKGHFSAMFLDYCGNASEELLRRTERVVAHGLAKDGLLGLAVQIGREQSTRELILKRRGNENRDSKDSFLARADFLTHELGKRCGIYPLMLLRYCGKGSDLRGQPMCVFLGSRDKSNTPSHMMFDPEPGEIQRISVELANDGQDAGLLLNVSRGTIAAWRAHVTRGTYGE